MAGQGLRFTHEGIRVRHELLPYAVWQVGPFGVVPGFQEPAYTGFRPARADVRDCRLDDLAVPGQRVGVGRVARVKKSVQDRLVQDQRVDRTVPLRRVARCVERDQPAHRMAE